jgi:hypothetical protein
VDLYLHYAISDHDLHKDKFTLFFVYRFSSINSHSGFNKHWNVKPVFNEVIGN